MLTLIKLLAALLMVTYLLRRRVPIDRAMIAGALALFILVEPTVAVARTAIAGTVINRGTWQLMLTMYLVMCLEYQLRTSGTLAGLMTAVRSLLSDRILLAFMPGFLGLLPSLGGAILSAPLVEDASKPYQLSSDAKATINFWFRHIWEFVNPIVPGLLLASEIVRIPLNVLIRHLALFSLLAGGIGWLFCLRRLVLVRRDTFSGSAQDNTQAQRCLIMSIGPIMANLLMVVVFKIDVAIAMGIVVLALVIVLRQSRRDIHEMLIYAFNRKLLGGVLSIIVFQQVLLATQVMQEVIVVLQGSGLALPLLVGIITFLVGLLSGSSQGVVGISFPIIAALAPGNIGLIIVGYVLGLAGHMLSPAHMCLVLTIQYFKADIISSMRPIVVMEIIMATAAFAMNWVIGWW